METNLMFDSSEEQRLMEALAAEMETLPIERVSVSALLKRAGVSRATFYRWYRDKYDLLNQNYQLLLDKTLCSMAKGTSYKQATLQIYETLQSSPVFYRNALTPRGQNSLYQYIYDRARETFEISCLWAKNGMKESPETLFRIFFQLMPEEFRTYISLYHM